MGIGSSWKDDGPFSSQVNVYRSLNCQIGKTFVAGCPGKKFRMPTWLPALLRRRHTSSELETISGAVLAFLTNLDTRLASSWADLRGATITNTSTRYRDAQTKLEEGNEMGMGTRVIDDDVLEEVLTIQETPLGWTVFSEDADGEALGGPYEDEIRAVAFQQGWEAAMQRVEDRG